MRIFFSDLVAVVDHQHLQPALTRHARAKQTGSPGTHDHHVPFLHGSGV